MTATIDFAPHETHRTMTVEAFLSDLVKQGMLDCVQTGQTGQSRPGKHFHGSSPELV